MVDLKEYFYNTNHYSDPIIKKFIYDFTDKFDPFLLIGLNKDFVNFYVNEMDLKDEYTKKDEYNKNSLLNNLIDEDQVLEMNDNILVRIYSYSNGNFEVKESRYQLENLNFKDYNDLRSKIEDFQFCMQEIVDSENSKVIKQYYTQTEPKDQDLTDTTVKESSYLGQPTNDKANDLFEFLIQYYRPDEKTSVKYREQLFT